MLLGVKIKQPDEVLDYDFIYDDWFGNSPDSIASVVAELVPGDGSMTAVAATPEATRLKVWLTGGTDGDIYKLEVTITTAAGRIKQDELEIQVQEY